MFVSIFSKSEQTVENLGGKGFGLWQMQQAGLNVPPALIIPTNFCIEYLENPAKVRGWIKDKLPEVREFFEGQFGHMPLLSVRSGARTSMPGMMDTILNVGLDPHTTPFWVEKLGAACTMNSRERLVEMYGSVVDEIDREDFEGLDVTKRLELYKEHTGHDFPNAEDQILGAIEAVFRSWNNDRAKIYRKMHGIPEDWGTAVTLQAMVFGNYNDQSATGVLFTRNPDNGDRNVTGEFLINAQGEDVVAGIKTPQPLGEMKAWNEAVYNELFATVVKLELDRKDVQDVEFTIQDGKLFILQTRNAKRSAQAAVKIALDMVAEKVLTPAEGVKRVTRAQYAMMRQPVLDPKFKNKADWEGIAACSGVATGVVVHSSKAAIDCTVPCILVTKETTPDDIAGMVAAKGVITMQGGSTSHAAVVARGMNKPCIVGVGSELEEFKKGQIVSIDGATGRIWLGEIPVIDNSKSEELDKFHQLMLTAGDVQLISDDHNTPCAMLDLSEIIQTPAVALDRIRGRLLQKGEFIVDISPGDSEAGKMIGMFSDPVELQQEILRLMSIHLTEEQLARVSVSTECTGHKGEKLVQLISRVTTLEALIESDGSFEMALKVSKAVKKVLEWKAKENCHPMVFGARTGGNSFLSHEQVIAELLG
ncbi:pyruvate phosphate dikinase [Stenotrophomonas phage vB_SmaS_DLP_3]|nr:pyruvate phosphate dikinase [Stenotrophomonas phage vB_SmaS_DLP_3]